VCEREDLGRMRGRGRGYYVLRSGLVWLREEYGYGYGYGYWRREEIGRRRLD
jgi:hypothetical protein